MQRRRRRRRRRRGRRRRRRRTRTRTNGTNVANSRRPADNWQFTWRGPSTQLASPFSWPPIAAWPAHCNFGGAARRLCTAVRPLRRRPFVSPIALPLGESGAPLQNSGRPREASICLKRRIDHAPPRAPSDAHSSLSRVARRPQSHPVASRAAARHHQLRQVNQSGLCGGQAALLPAHCASLGDRVASLRPLERQQWCLRFPSGRNSASDWAQFAAHKCKPQDRKRQGAPHRGQSLAQTARWG